MPQFNPLWWISLLSWLFLLLSISTWYNQSISLPAVLRNTLARTKLA